MNARIKLSLKLGILGGIIWGLFFTAYYSMLPNYKFAYITSTICFIIMVVFLLSLPKIIKSFKDAAEQRKLENDEEQDEK